MCFGKIISYLNHEIVNWKHNFRVVIRIVVASCKSYDGESFLLYILELLKPQGYCITPGKITKKGYYSSAMDYLKISFSIVLEALFLWAI